MATTTAKILALLTLLLSVTQNDTSHAAQATLTWQNNAPTATETVIQRRLNTDPPDQYAQIATVKTPENTYTDKTLEAEKIYCWVVYAKNITTVSQKSAENCLLAEPGWTAILYLK